MTNETFCGNRHIYFGLSKFGHIKKDFMEIKPKYICLFSQKVSFVTVTLPNQC